MSATKGRMSRGPSCFPSTKAACSPSPREMVPPRRGRRSHHVRKVAIGTQIEARPGPSDWSPMGVQRQGRPERCAELRSGVGPVHSTEEVTEGDVVMEGRDRLFATSQRAAHSYPTRADAGLQRALQLEAAVRHRCRSLATLASQHAAPAVGAPGEYQHPGGDRVPA